jgi:hypothetical protein
MLQPPLLLRNHNEEYEQDSYREREDGRFLFIGRLFLPPAGEGLGLVKSPYRTLSTNFR